MHPTYILVVVPVSVCNINYVVQYWGSVGPKVPRFTADSSKSHPRNRSKLTFKCIGFSLKGIFLNGMQQVGRNV